MRSGVGWGGGLGKRQHLLQLSRLPCRLHRLGGGLTPRLTSVLRLHAPPAAGWLQVGVVLTKPAGPAGQPAPAPGVERLRARGGLDGAWSVPR